MRCLLKYGRKLKKNVLHAENGMNDSGEYLLCITQEGEFDSEYKFRIQKPNNEITEYIEYIIMKIDWEKAEAWLEGGP